MEQSSSAKSPAPKLRFLSLSKLKLFRAAKEIVFKRMDNKSITPERADEILAYLKKTIPKCRTWEDMRAYPEQLARDFPELKPVAIKIEFEEREHIDQVLAHFVEHIVESGDFEFATEVIEKVHEFQAKKGGNIEEIRNIKPEVFDELVQKLNQ